MKRAFTTMPMMLPRMSDRAAAQLLDVLGMLHECMRHHYGPQAQLWHARQRRRASPPSPHRSRPPPHEEPF